MAATCWALRAHAGCGTEAVAVSAPAVAAPDDATGDRARRSRSSRRIGRGRFSARPAAARHDHEDGARSRDAHVAHAATNRVAKWPGGPSALFPLSTTAVGAPIDPDPIDLATRRHAPQSHECPLPLRPTAGPGGPQADESQPKHPRSRRGQPVRAVHQQPGHVRRGGPSTALSIEPSISSSPRSTRSIRWLSRRSRVEMT